MPNVLASAVNNYLGMLLSVQTVKSFGWAQNDKIYILPQCIYAEEHVPWRQAYVIDKVFPIILQTIDYYSMCCSNIRLKL